MAEGFDNIEDLRLSEARGTFSIRQPFTLGDAPAPPFDGSSPNLSLMCLNKKTNNVEFGFKAVGKHETSLQEHSLKITHDALAKAGILFNVSGPNAGELLVPNRRDFDSGTDYFSQIAGESVKLTVFQRPYGSFMRSEGTHQKAGVTQMVTSITLCD